MTSKLVNRMMKAKELELIRMCHTIRVIIGVSKKVVFKLMREMRNGALWIKYSIDGVNCSTFAKAPKVIEEIRMAHISMAPVVRNWVVACAQSMGITAYWNHGDIAVTVEYQGRFFYVSTSIHDQYQLFANNMMKTVRATADDAKTMIAYIMKNYAVIN